MTMRLPFDPKKAKGAATPPAEEVPCPQDVQSPNDKSKVQGLTVTQACDLIKTTLETRIPSPLRVVGEVSNLSTPGHWYFSLKDSGAVLSCVAWASAAKKFGFTPRDGDAVLATGHISHYLPQGKTQMYVSSLQPVGAGALELKFRALCHELRTLGYFDESRKKQLPVFPKRIAVITSKDGAAVHDVIATAAQRCRAVGLVIVDVRVQGAAAAPEIAKAIAWVDRHRKHLGVDALLVTRGGGSIEDLWAFNERIVADAVMQCSLPVVAAIGHESDTTIIELVADVRAATPTQAVMRLVPAGAELEKQLAHHAHRLLFALRRGIEARRERLATLARHEFLRDPMWLAREKHKDCVRLDRELIRAVRLRLADAHSRVERLAGRLDRLRPEAVAAGRKEQLVVLQARLQSAVMRRLDVHRLLRSVEGRLGAAIGQHLRRCGQRAAGLESQLRAVDPDRVLARGYSYTQRADGTIVRSMRDVVRGDLLHTRVADGTIDSVVGGAEKKPPLRKRDEKEQLRLF